MSVDKRRLAAAQRTAALRKPSTTKRLCAWIIIVPALALFSFSVVAGAAGFGAKPAREKVVGLFVYMLFYECCLYWLNLWALFTVENRSWVTRTSTAQA